eukprot:TRINITY_DN2742_c0_g1_i3.p1 TRINITY_DN2742_c0_g1~~TRINITY_DN2742_c0_g1_i3.p1  ORF type:complete len:167 (+),score=14.02 TRINITY_DN2742_c0_g1_i3:66-566(+)
MFRTVRPTRLLSRPLTHSSAILRNLTSQYTKLVDSSKIGSQDNAPQTMDRSTQVFSLGGTDDWLQDDTINLFTGYNDNFFRLSNVLLYGSILVSDRFYWMWNINSMEEITIESLALVECYHPTPSILVVGTGTTLRRLPETVHEHFRKLGIAIETASTVCSNPHTF